jgi:membrane associated rhomboid family serine protease
MFPLYSDRPLSSVPFVTVLLIILNAAVFWLQVTMPGGLEQSVLQYGMIPSHFFHPHAAGVPTRIHPFLTVLTSMFMHGGFFHLGSNMLYLWVFGRNIEDDYGHLRFLLFYLAAGVLATLAFTYLYPASRGPLVGASGAIAGVLGAYFLRFPASSIHTLIIIIIIPKIVTIPAFFILGLWFFIQIGSCAVSCTAPLGAAGQGGGIAFISHIAGFVFGMVYTIWLLGRRFHSGGRL